ncbi:uncharacterized protein LOC101785884 [Setaria italica]|uniref:uncharacterized protein LOC101785884 n=1 Tax=Setaria italica TaxID=4555 RepID=UPI000350B5D0|nr:uncharacterized protein LOC101785884 [Setaria italica]XP_034569886.1 uncharacterized protein LOC117834404 [Setaria viridis]
MEQAFKVVEIELVLMYESIHSKAPVIHGWLGRGLRVFTLAAPVVSLVLFARAAGDMRGYARVDVHISYVLLGGAVFLETYAILLMVISPWTYADLRASERLRPAPRAVLWLIKLFQPETRPRWSNRMSQYNLISYCLNDEPRWYKGLMERLEWRWNFRVKTMWDSWRYTKKITVPKDLKRLVFDQLKSKANSTMDLKSYQKLGEHRASGRSSARARRPVPAAGVERRLRVRRQHPALAHRHRPLPLREQGRHLAEAAVMISICMLYLLVMRPFMMTVSIGQIRFGNTCAEAKGSFRRADEAGDEAGCVERLRAVDTSIVEPRDVKGDRSKSVLFQAYKLAQQLLELEGATEAKRCRLVASVWVEMLCYAAGKCSGSAHARQLSQGGELLNLVWLLMAHFGVGDQYRVESGHARAKLVVDR